MSKVLSLIPSDSLILNFDARNWENDDLVYFDFGRKFNFFQNDPGKFWDIDFWNASLMYDYLCDLNWIESKNIIIIIENLSSLKKHKHDGLFTKSLLIRLFKKYVFPYWKNLRKYPNSKHRLKDIVVYYT